MRTNGQFEGFTVGMRPVPSVEPVASHSGLDHAALPRHERRALERAGAVERRVAPDRKRRGRHAVAVVDARDRGLGEPRGGCQRPGWSEVLASDVLLRRPHAAGEEGDLVRADLRCAERRIKRLHRVRLVHLDLLEDEESVRRQVGEVGADLRLDRGRGLQEIGVRLRDRRHLRRRAEDARGRDDDDHEDADRDQHLGEREGAPRRHARPGLGGLAAHQSSSTAA
jgi:hypothetical protein